MMVTNKRNWLLDILMLPVGIMTFFPFYLIIVNTLKSTQETARSPMSLPQRLDFSNYVKVFKETDLLRSFEKQSDFNRCVGPIHGADRRYGGVSHCF
ncbi:hypothetical protein [Paenibacillus sp. V4I7]|uniref:hypothetical protein n=1 Tax=Paenibacillus sp. V4I7 TaxID=3042307 RepID=UPI00278671F4|nr:hypothetical protein [Paenibacillus sp. V4I7]MDQ0902135.1 ABC-type glycerol-3-phosphate transport system permease component [Paenibacillus sp. V4I7]